MKTTFSGHRRSLRQAPPAIALFITFLLLAFSGNTQRDSARVLSATLSPGILPTASIVACAPGPDPAALRTALDSLLIFDALVKRKFAEESLRVVGLRRHYKEMNAELTGELQEHYRQARQHARNANAGDLTLTIITAIVQAWQLLRSNR